MISRHPLEVERERQAVITHLVVRVGPVGIVGQVLPLDLDDEIEHVALL